MTTIGIIGGGQIGTTLARLATEAGHEVVLSNSRGPETLANTVAELGPQASAATSSQVTVPVSAFPGLPAAPLAGKTVIDTCNYGPERDGHILELEGTSLTSSELLLRHLPDAQVVKAFNNIFFKHLLALGRPAGTSDRSYLPIAGNSATAKRAVTELIDSLGYNVVDAGPLADSWRQETGTPVWGPRTGRTRTRVVNLPARAPSAQHWPPQRGNPSLIRLGSRRPHLRYVIRIGAWRAQFV
jgi:predicted dinucleotide-binding enzyme